MPYFICPNCRRRSIDHDRREDLTNEAVGCAHCGFGFLFELLDDYYPAPNAAFFVTDQSGRVIACGRGAFELTGLADEQVIGRPANEVLGLQFDDESDHVATAALAAAYGPALRPGFSAVWAPIVTIAPFPDFRSSGREASTDSTVGRRLVANCFSKSIQPRSSSGALE